MDLLIPLAAAILAAALAVIVTRAICRNVAARQLAEARTEMSAQLAAAHQDTKWLRQEIDRQQQALGSTREMLDAAERKLRDTFQSLAAEALKDNRASF